MGDEEAAEEQDDHRIGEGGVEVGGGRGVGGHRHDGGVAHQQDLGEDDADGGGVEGDGLAHPEADGEQEGAQHPVAAGRQAVEGDDPRDGGGGERSGEPDALGVGGAGDRSDRASVDGGHHLTLCPLTWVDGREPGDRCDP